MELLYVWIENYDLNQYDGKSFIENQEINISKEYNISCKNSTLYINKNETQVSLFSPPIKSCNAIIGQNGAGKTTFIRMLINSLNFKYDDTKKIIIFKDGDEFKIYNNLDCHFELIINSKSIGEDKVQKYRLNDDNYEDIKKNLSIIHYSPSYSLDYKSWVGDLCTDISTNYLLRHSANKKVYKEAFTLLKYNDLVQIKHFINNKDNDLIFNTLKFDKPDKLKLDIITGSLKIIHTSYGGIYELYTTLRNKLINNKKDNTLAILSFSTALIFKDFKETNNHKKFNEYFDKMISKVCSKKTEWANDLTIKEFKEYTNDFIDEEDDIIGNFKSILDDYNRRVNTLKAVVNIIEQQYDLNDRRLKDIASIIENNKTIDEDKEQINIIEALSLLNSIEFRRLTTPYPNKEEEHYDFLSNIYEEQLKPNEYFLTANINKSNDSLNSLTELFKYSFFQEIFQVSWAYERGVSAGQDIILTMYARFYDFFKNSLKPNENIIIFLDEPDLYLHPNWKRVFLYEFMEFFKIVAKDKKIQLFITTNDPYIISDLPKDNIIFLENKSGKCKVCDNNEFQQTFGANIHTLLTNSFFMDNTMGEFANQKIKTTLKIIDKYKQFSMGNINEEQFKKEYKQYMMIEEIENVEIDEEKLKKKIKYTIDIIGESIIRRKLEEIYIEAFIKDNQYYEEEILKLQNEKAKLNEIINSKGLDNIDGIMALLDEKIKELKKKADGNL